ncbi:hypothetical protein [Portibacter lacus]|uniref:Uncharacterized protein n=1 Tax=Portibacter lacus TaxID=1099794 RepID=A0AA37WD06_9BACT|nr:hypothetical protein [Portibacter lacus]GLR17366.1 hypothetical protein GCM10007940_19810 [Portibacter lacus]
MNSYFYDFDIYISSEEDIPSALLQGDNEKKLLVIVNAADYTAENKAFLAKILSAISYDLDKDANVLVLPKEKSYSVTSLIKNGFYTNVLIFGINLKDIGFSVSTYLYAPFEIAGKTYLINHPLEKVKSSVDFKKSLWTALQAMPFNK